jgi:hypothetical protein
MARDKGRLSLKDDIEVAIGLNVDCGGAEGVYKVRDAVLAAVLPHLEAAYKRGEMAGSSRSGYKIPKQRKEEQ